MGMKPIQLRPDVPGDKDRLIGDYERLLADPTTFGWYDITPQQRKDLEAAAYAAGVKRKPGPKPKAEAGGATD